MTVDKIIKSCKDGSIKWKIKNRCKHLFYIKNKNVWASAYQDVVYKTLSKQFAKEIRRADYGNLPQKNSKKVWICWLQGYEQSPEPVKACINSVRVNMPEYEIVILTDENISEYVNFPENITEKYCRGRISRTHYSDLIRAAVLCEWGGIWLDSTVLCTEKKFPEYISSLPLFVYKCVDLTRRDTNPIVASSWLIACRSNQPIMLLTRDLLYAYWEKYDYLMEYFLFHIFFAMATRKFEDDWKAVPVFNNHSPHILQFELQDRYDENRWNQIMNMSSFHKLNRHIDYSKFEDSNYKEIIKRYGNADVLL